MVMKAMVTRMDMPTEDVAKVMMAMATRMDTVVMGMLDMVMATMVMGTTMDMTVTCPCQMDTQAISSQ
jgi:hypothetical protein